MAVYTISPCLMRNLREDELCFIRDLLYIFVNGEHKVAKDIDGRVIDIYASINRFREFIQIWLQLMTLHPSRFELVPISLDGINSEEDKFLALCSSTKGQHKMIVYSRQLMKCNVNELNGTSYNDMPIQLVDKDEAIYELRSGSVNYNLINSICAGGNVENSNNNK